jgi:hypothetical protein
LGVTVAFEDGVDICFASRYGIRGRKAVDTRNAGGGSLRGPGLSDALARAEHRRGSDVQIEADLDTIFN